MHPDNKHLTTSPEMIEHIKHWEGFRSRAYKCPAGILTIGYGHTSDDFYEVHSGSKISRAEAEAMLMHDIREAEAIVRNEVHVKLNRNQFSALVSFVFNRGSLHYWYNGVRRASTLLSKLNNSDYAGAAAEFKRWVNAKDPKTGKLRKLKGLVRRRKIEADYFKTEDTNDLPIDKRIRFWEKILPALPHTLYGEVYYE